VKPAHVSKQAACSMEHFCYSACTCGVLQKGSVKESSFTLLASPLHKARQLLIYRAKIPRTPAQCFG